MHTYRINLLVLIVVIALFLVAACEQKIKKVYDPSIPCPPETLTVVVHDTVFVKVPCHDRD